MGALHVHEFMSLDGVIDAPTWTFDYGLVDELNLCVHPLTRGEGPRLFPPDAAPGKLTLAACESYDCDDDGVLLRSA